MTEFMKIVMEFLVPTLLIIIVITQILLPLFVQDLSFFWLFKKGGRKHMSLDEEAENVDKQVETPVRGEKKGIDVEVDDLTQEMTANADKLKKSTGKVDEVVSKLQDAKNSSLNNLKTTHNSNE